MLVLACMDDPAPAPGAACVNEQWVQQPSLLPALPVADAVEICTALLTAFAAVMIVKIVAKKTQ